MQNSIGGYFGLEISDNGSLYHDQAIALNSGRNALEHILSCKDIKHLYIPYFTCEVILQPIVKLNIPYTFYHISENFIPLLPPMNSDDTVLYTNYFGLMNDIIVNMSEDLDSLIVDNSQAFFDFPVKNTPTFYSPRKFFGLPDGGFAYNADCIEQNLYEIDKSHDRISHMITRIEDGPEAGYSFFIENDAKLNNQPNRLMSNLTMTLLRGIDYKKVIQKRLKNFSFLHSNLKSSNKLSGLIEQSHVTCPMIYPYYIENGEQLRVELSKNRIYTATYWPNVLNWTNIGDLESDLTLNMIPLPIDQRYNQLDLEIIVNTINGY